MGDALEGFHEVLVVPAGLLRVHLVGLHASVDHFDWVSQEASDQSAQHVSVDVVIGSSVATGVLDNAVVEVEEAGSAGGGVGDSSKKESMEVHVEFAEATA